MGKRIYELAKEMNKASKDVVDKAHQLGMDVKTIWAQLFRARNKASSSIRRRKYRKYSIKSNKQPKATNNTK